MIIDCCRSSRDGVARWVLCTGVHVVACIFLWGQFALQTAGAQATATSAKSAEVVHGRVLDDSARALVTTVYVTRGADRVTQHVSTDSAGYYTTRFEEGTGDYLVFVAAAGFQSARRRVQRQGNETEFVVNFTLVREVKALDVMQIRAQKPVPVAEPVTPHNPEIGAAEQWKDGLNGLIPPMRAGVLDAIAGTMSSVTLGPRGPAVLGAGPESNLRTLNGMGLASGVIPRAARTETRVTTATYDPARGGFAGANVDVRLGPGSRVVQNRNAFITLNPRQWQWTDATGRAFGGSNGGVSVSVGADGELIRRALTYNVALDVTREVSTPATLLRASPTALRSLGISPDSAARLLATAPTLGLSLSGRGIPDVSRHEALTWLGRFDDTRDTLQTRAFTTYVGLDRIGALGFNPLSAPSTAGHQLERTLGAQLVLGRYVGSSRRFLTETRLAASQVHTKTTPYRAQPSAIVLVPSVSADGENDISAVTLGGGSFWSSDATRWTVEGANETSWIAGGRRHRFKAQLWGRLDGSRQAGITNDFGAFTFNSIEDFQANRPTNFSRTLSQPTLAGTVWNTAASVTHAYAPSNALSMIYGARLEADGFTSAPARNLILDEALGVRSGVAPSRLHVSPRMGFSYRYFKGDQTTMDSPLGHLHTSTAGVLSGGIGEFRDLLRPDIRASAGAATGLSGSTTTVSCVGAAVPAIDWVNFAATPNTIPRQCVDGSGGLAELAPAVTLIDPAYDVPRSWRASLDWSTTVKALQVHLGGLVSYSLAQPGMIDANFSGVPRLTLANEAGRPVYVSAGGIDASTGFVSAAESRTSDLFGRVGMRVSDLRSYGGQFTLTASPSNFGTLTSPHKYFYTAGYTLQWVRRQYRGFEGAGFGDPRIREWAPDANDARHSVVVSGGVQGSRVGILTLFSRLQSGLPFTPIVQGDVNGDGQWGDRAFIPNPAAEPNTVLSNQLQALLANGTSSARHCLEASLGRIAPRNGCRSPWTQSLNLQWSPAFSLWNRLQPNIYVQNVLGGLDQAFHGSQSLQGWGAQAMPDPVLLIPRGFDPIVQRFAYEVNPRFGDTRSNRPLSPTPFRVTMDFSVNLSTDYEVQHLRRNIEPVRSPQGGQRRSAASIAAAYLSNTTSPAKVVLDQSDSLFLDTTQIAALGRSDSIYSAHVRAIYISLGVFLAQRGEHAGKVALDSAKATRKTYLRDFWDEVDHVTSLITPTQRGFVPILGYLLQIPAWQRDQTEFTTGFPVTLAP